MFKAKMSNWKKASWVLLIFGTSFTDIICIIAMYPFTKSFKAISLCWWKREYNLKTMNVLDSGTSEPALEMFPFVANAKERTDILPKILK